MPNNALHGTAIPLRSIAAGELGKELTLSTFSSYATDHASLS